MCTYVCACVYVGLFLNSVQPRCALAHQLCQALSLLWARRVDRNHLDPDPRRLLLVRDAPTPQVCWGQKPRGTLMGRDSWRVSGGGRGSGRGEGRASLGSWVPSVSRGRAWRRGGLEGGLHTQHWVYGLERGQCGHRGRQVGSCFGPASQLESRAPRAGEGPV